MPDPYTEENIAMLRKSILIVFLSHASLLWAQSDNNDINSLISQGEAIYTLPGNCITCHMEDATGNPSLNSKSLRFGPSPLELSDALNSVPQMGPVAVSLNLTNSDLLALSIYLRHLSGLELGSDIVDELRATTAGISTQRRDEDFVVTQRDRVIDQYGPFQSVLDTWERKSKTGNIMHTYKTVVTNSWPTEEAKFTPEAGKTYFYQNTGDRGDMFGQGFGDGDGNAVTVGDAETHQVVAQKKLGSALRGSVHTTGMTPNGKYGYIIGPPIRNKSDEQLGGGLSVLAVSNRLNASASLVKWNALTLAAEKVFVIGGRMHHIQTFQDRYMLVDTFARDDDGLDVFLMDPETDEIIGGVRDEELGGASYTAFQDGKYIYILMQPSVYGPMALTGYVGANNLNYGKAAVLRPFWVAKIDPETWEVVKEYPYPGYRGDWICFDAAKEHMFIPASGSANLTKINIESGEIVWVNPTGIGPYGCNVSADDSQVWIADKGEANGFFGRTITVLRTEDGKALDTLPSAYMVDHVLLSPNGEEFWATSNAEGSLYVFDAAERELITKIQMPGGGDAHGLAWVHYDEDGNSRLVRDQGGFTNSVDPRNGRSLPN
jgi:hypothetical protein